MSINTQSEVVVSCCKVHLTGCHTICLLVAQFCWLRGSRFTSPELCRFSMYFLNKIKHIDLLYREKCFCNVLNSFFLTLGQLLWGGIGNVSINLFTNSNLISLKHRHNDSYRGQYTQNVKGLFHVKWSLHLVQACIDFSPSSV